MAELRQWIRFSSNRALATGDGLFSACSGNPVVPEWIGGPMFSAFFTKDAENEKYRSQIASSAGVAVFTGDRADLEHWTRVGRSFQRFSLQATALGVRNAHVNQPIEVPSVRPAFANWLGAPDARPDLVVRLVARPLAHVVATAGRGGDCLADGRTPEATQPGRLCLNALDVTLTHPSSLRLCRMTG